MAGTPGEVGMRRLGRIVTRRRWFVLVGAMLFVPLAAVVGGGVEEHLDPGGFLDPSTEAARAADALDERFGTGSPNFLLLVTAREGTVDDAAVAAAGLALTEELAARPEITDVVSYWSLDNASPLRSTDSSMALVLGRVPGDDSAVQQANDELAPAFERTGDVIDVGVGGVGETYRQISTQSEQDLRKAEAISLPITLLLLIAVFGSVVAAGLPLAVGILAILATFLVLRVIAGITEVSFFSLNLTSAMGLGLAIDYSLFVVSRYREELAAGWPTERAIIRTLHTAGRTVVFSALTVAISLVALIVFPLPFLRSFAYAGVPVVASAAIGAVVVLPALLVAIGPRIDKGTVFRRRRSGRTERPHEGFWYRRARAVMRRPLPVVVVVVAFLVALGIPFLHIELGLSDDRVLPEGAAVRQVHDEIRTSFASQEAGAISVVATDAAGAEDDLDEYAARLSALDGVARVDAATGFYIDGGRVLGPNELSRRFDGGTATWLSVVPSIEPLSAEGEDLVEAIRDEPAPYEILVGGRSAELVDGRDSLFSRLPLAIGIIAVSTFVLLFLMVGSILVPLKALALNLLSLSATFGALVWIFQDGHFAGVLDFTATGTISIVTPVLLFCITFGLSMDYEVFLLSRIKEEYDLGRDNDEAVAIGLQHTGPIVTAAAVLLAIVFISFASSGVSVVKVFGIGVALAVIVDAFLIRATLVPAFMALAGRANWWAPRSLRRVQLRYGIWEAEPIEVVDLARAEREHGGTREAETADAPGGD